MYEMLREKAQLAYKLSKEKKKRERLQTDSGSSSKGAGGKSAGKRVGKAGKREFASFDGFKSMDFDPEVAAMMRDEDE